MQPTLDERNGKKRKKCVMQVPIYLFIYVAIGVVELIAILAIVFGPWLLHVAGSVFLAYVMAAAGFTHFTLHEPFIVPAVLAGLLILRLVVGRPGDAVDEEAADKKKR